MFHKLKKGEFIQKTACALNQTITVMWYTWRRFEQKIKGPLSQPHLSFLFTCSVQFGYYILFGSYRNEGNNCETTEDNCRYWKWRMIIAVNFQFKQFLERRSLKKIRASIVDTFSNTLHQSNKINEISLQLEISNLMASKMAERRLIMTRVPLVAFVGIRN